MKDINTKSNSDNVSSELNILKFKWSFYSERCWSSEPKMRSNKNNGETEKKNMIMRLSIMKYSLLFGGKWHQNGDLFMEVVWKISLWILADRMRCCWQFWKLYSVWFEQFEQISAVKPSICYICLFIPGAELFGSMLISCVSTADFLKGLVFQPVSVNQFSNFCLRGHRFWL